MTRSTILVIDDDPSLGRLLAHWLQRDDHEVLSAETAAEGLDALTCALPDAILLDLNLPDAHGLEVLATVKQRHPRLPVVMMTVDADVDTVVRCMQYGAFDYLPKPVDRTKLFTTVRNAVDKGRADLRIAQLEREVDGSGYPGILGQSPQIRELFRQMDRVAPSDITVLVRGESGTGKELVASGLHSASPRHSAPFVAVNCAAIPENLQESELFGHEKGAFTGADQRRIGRFEQANGGTLFLDEVGELSLPLQAKLLRALQEQSFYRVGGSSEVRVNLRILAATHRDLRAMVADGRFREDLYYRLAVFELAVPPLRTRDGDLLLLAERFLREVGARYGRTNLRLSHEARERVERHPWPGNVRELRNAMERAAVLARDGVVQLADLPPSLVLGPPTARPQTTEPPKPQIEQEPTRLSDIERAAILRALDDADGNVSEVVRTLGIPRTTLYRRLREYGVR
ncbi:MAG: sigma-54-dependent Fis family transcriptional regulator [Deltaproteobacteria bacterium]|nr:MAG: sigma-54-dependent Fis family transcriptional regulator [Deltaproteobacteria bacterium]